MIRSDYLRRIVLISAAAIHLFFAVTSGHAPAVLSGWLALDALGQLFLCIVSVLFLIASIYGVGYLAREKGTAKQGLFDAELGTLLVNSPESLLTGCLLFFLSAMTLVCVSNHLGLLWVAIEATTLASAPMIYFHHRRQSLEAAWKYLLICSIGIALALFGNFLLAVSTSTVHGGELPLLLDQLLRNASSFHPQWLKPAFIFLLVGYGTKMGLAPLHTWLPDAHSESPSFVSALLSGALLNCAFLGILRAQQILTAAGLAFFGQELLVGFGLLSMGFAAAFIVQQPDYKRMLAYSSVEHMGILALGVGLGGTAVFGAMFHAVNHSLTKGMLFLIAGNILSVMRTKTASDIRGLSRLIPFTAALWMAGFLAITGSPPFGTFLSEFTILKSALEQGHYIVAIAYLLILSVVFIAMASIIVRMVQGNPLRNPEPRASREPWLMILPPLFLCMLIVILGLYMPPALERLLLDAATVIGGAS
ncbi:NADH dehydrogenase FAD-containing subunit [candidate division KSB1 bacterium]|nr:MAG: NADH dehydrogenase FAD-containing subunit [candidate division KSB1 bacterium]